MILLFNKQKNQQAFLSVNQTNCKFIHWYKVSRLSLKAGKAF